MTERPSFDEVFDETLPYLLHVLRRLGVREDDREDRAQDVLLAVYQSLPTYDPARPLKPWLHGIAFNVVRKDQALARNQREVLMDDVAEPMDDASDTERITDEKMDRELLIRLMQGLTLDLRVVVSMHIDGIEMLDIVRELGIALATGYKRLETARRKLQAAAVRIQHREQRAGGAVVAFNLAAFLATDRTIPEVPSDVRARLWSRLQDAVPAVPAMGSAPPATPGPAVPSGARLAKRLAAHVAKRVAPYLVGAAAGAAGMYAYLGPPKPSAPDPIARHVPPPARAGEAASTTVTETTAGPIVAAGPATATAATAATARATVSAVSAPASTEENEEALIQRARIAQARGDASGAIDALNLHARRFPRGDLAGDREGIRAQVLQPQGIDGSTSAQSGGSSGAASVSSARRSNRIFGTDD